MIMFCIYVLISSLLLCHHALTTHTEEVSGEHTCPHTSLEHKQINVTYLQSARIKVWKFCLKHITLRCAEYETVMEKKWKLENISRVVVRKKCCPGYEQLDGGCVPTCEQPCLNGECVQPEVCRCNSGYSGKQCEVNGCPDGRWGDDCAEDCLCQHGGFCNPVHGGCSCTPGYHGLRCQDKCMDGYFGAGCKQTCNCTTGTLCNHVLGDCVPCDRGWFGDGCANQCSCDEAGTEMCASTTGKCFCKDNRFGLRCELYCPFGYINNTCYKDPIENNSCQCANHLFTCDLELGCVCPDGVDCGIEQQAHQVFETATFSGNESSKDGSTVAVLAVTIIVLVAFILMVVYYRRRMHRLKSDLETRSVRYYQDPYRTNALGSDLVVQDHPPLGEQHYVQSYSASGANIGTELLNNQLTLSSQELIRSTQGARKEKNTNIDNFKLGFQQPNNSTDSCAETCQDKLTLDTCASATAGAVGGAVEDAGGCCVALPKELGPECKDDIESSGIPPLVVGNGTGVLFDDVNVLNVKTEIEKTSKPKLSLSFKNNILREDEQQQQQQQGEDASLQPQHNNQNSCAAKHM